MKMVKKICSLLLLLSLFICPICYGKNVFESVPIGKVEIEENILLDGENCYPLLKVKNQYYVPLSSLEKMGATLTEENQTLYIIGPLERNKWSDFSVELFEDQIAYMRAYPVYYNNIRSFSLMVQNEILVPLQLLEAMWDIKEYSDTFIIQDKLQNPLYLVEINEKGIHNKTDHLLPVHYSHIYWNGKSYEVTKEYTLLEESEAKEWLLDEEKLYITTVVTQISGLDLEIDETLYGQYYEPIFRQYSQALRLNALDHQFPIFKIQGQVKYNVGPFKEKDFVEICRSEKNNYFVVKDDSGKKYQVPYNSIRVIGEKGAILNKVTNQDIEDFATLSEIESATDYLLWTDIIGKELTS